MVFATIADRVSSAPLLHHTYACCHRATTMAEIIHSVRATRVTVMKSITPLTDSNRPSARELTRFLIAAAAGQSSSNQLLMTWGQFLSHDMARSSQLNSDCSNCIFNAFSCANIPVFRNDPRFIPSMQLITQESVQIRQPSLSASST